MPCRSYDDYDVSAEYARKLDGMAAMLCTVCTYLEQSNLPIPGAAAVWWKNHKAADKAAAEAERKRESNRRKKKNALTKLTEEEIKLLGILDR